MTISNKILLKEKIDQNLVTRIAADRLFQYINHLPNKIVILDFSDIKFISRSFAHEYHIKKDLSKKSIRETNLSEETIRMFKLVTENTISYAHNSIPVKTLPL